MAQFRKKPVVIDAVKWNGATIGLTNGGEPFVTERVDFPEWMPPVVVLDDGSKVYYAEPGLIMRVGDSLFIGTLEGTMEAAPGDWIIRGVKGELYPIKDEIFGETYDAVPEPEPVLAAA